MKREQPATPFRVVGPDHSEWTTSSESPDQPMQSASNMPAIRDAVSQDALQSTSATTTMQRGRRTSSSGQAAAGSSTGQDGASLNQFNTQNIQQNTLNHLQHNVHHTQSINHMVDPQQLEQMVNATFQYRVEATVSQMRDQMNAQLARLEIEHQARLSQAEHASRQALQHMQAEGSQQITQIQRERERSGDSADEQGFAAASASSAREGHFGQEG